MRQEKPGPAAPRRRPVRAPAPFSRLPRADSPTGSCVESPTDRPSCSVADLRPPPRLMLLLEARVAFEYAASWASLPLLRARAPKGHGEPVLVVPGFGSDDSYTTRLRSFLSSLGYRVRGWGLGRNDGRVSALVPRVVERTAELAAEAGSKVVLVGWSLGGYLAREVARARPDLVGRVITLGAPVVGGPKYTASASMYRKRGYDLDEIEAAVAQREANPLEVQVAAVFSRSDGVVAWKACVDHLNPRVTHHEVISSHLGLVCSPVVFLLVARLLSEEEE